MRLTSLPSEFQKAFPILKKIQEAGYQAYFVGGCVRDVLLEKAIHDVDIASSAYPEEIKQLFERTIDVGIEHGTVLVLEDDQEYEITTFRTEEAYVDYRRPSQVNFVRSLEEDLKRRDFTINAFALDHQGELIDLFDGLMDLNNQLLRAVGQPSERFQEDALRIMRGFRFQASLGFELEDKTQQAMTDCAPLLNKIAIERVFIEFEKLLLADKWYQGLTSFVEAQAHLYLPGFAEEGPAFAHFLEKIKKDFAFSSSEQAWGGLLYYFSIPAASQVLKDWKTSREFQRNVLEVLEILRLRDDQDLSAWDFYRFQERLVIEAEELRAAMGLEANLEVIHQGFKRLPIRKQGEIPVTGRVLIQEEGLLPGPHLGKILKHIEREIVIGNLPNDKNAIINYIREKHFD